jgi:hypothetical protein
MTGHLTRIGQEIAPHRRHSVEHTVQAWGDSVKLRAEARLSEETIKAAPPVVQPPAPLATASKERPARA